MKSSKAELISFWKQFSDRSNKPVKPIDFSLIDRVSRFFSPASFYYYIINFAELKVEFVSDNYQLMTGLDPNTFSLEQWLEPIHASEIDFVHKCEKVAGKFLFDFLSTDQILQYKVSYTYKMRGIDNQYFQSLHQATAISLTENNFIGCVLGVETNIEHLINRPKKKISFIDLKSQKHYLNIDVDNPDFINSVKFPYGFTQQEMNIIELISHGNSSNEIADLLSISNHTVRKHRENALAKTPSNNMTSLIADLLRQGYL